MSYLRIAQAAVVGFCAWFIEELVRGGTPWTPAFFLALSFPWMLWARSGGELWKKYSRSALFWICLAVYLSTFRWHGGDDIPNSLLPFALLRHGTLLLDPVLNPWLAGKAHDFIVPITTGRMAGHTLSFFPVTPAVLALPVYLIPALAGTPINEAFLHNLSKISAALIASGSAVALYAALTRRCSRPWALTLAFLYALGSWAFSVSSQALYQHGPAQLGVAIGLLGVVLEGRKGSLLAGFGMGLAVAARPDSVFFFGAVAAFFLFNNWRKLMDFAWGAALPLALLAAYWLYYTGYLKPPEYGIQQSMFTHFQWTAFTGLLLSPTRGFLLFFPAAVFGVWAVVRTGRDPAAPWLLAGCVATWVFFSFYAAWVGGSSYGPRYLAGTAPVWAYLCAGIEREVRSSRTLLWIWCGVVSVSILIHALGGYMTWPGSSALLNEFASVWNWRLHPIPFLFSASGNLSALPAFARAGIGFLLLAFCGGLAAGLHRFLYVGGRT